MRIKSVFSHSFEKYGKVLSGYDVTELLKKLDETTKKPADAVIYEPGDAGLEALPIAKEFSENAYGGMPIQIGYCNGNNTKLNCLEWHRGSELNIPSSDIVLLVAPLQAVKNGKLSTSMVEAFRASSYVGRTLLKSKLIIVIFGLIETLPIPVTLIVFSIVNSFFLYCLSLMVE